MKRARKVKLAGATAFEAYEGYGASGLLHRTHSLSDDAPVTIMIIDRAERVEAFLLEAKDLLESVLVTIADLEVLEL
jgi:PII-like signaling protein